MERWRGLSGRGKALVIAAVGAVVVIIAARAAPEEWTDEGESPPPPAASPAEEGEVRAEPEPSDGKLPSRIARWAAAVGATGLIGAGVALAAFIAYDQWVDNPQEDNRVLAVAAILGGTLGGLILTAAGLALLVSLKTERFNRGASSELRA